LKWQQSTASGTTAKQWQESKRQQQHHSALVTMWAPAVAVARDGCDREARDACDREIKDCTG